MKTAPNSPIHASAQASFRGAGKGSPLQPVRLLVAACGFALGLATGTVPAQSARTNTPAPPAPSKSPSKPATGKSAAAPTPATGTFDDFKTIPERNIFNTRRLAGRVQSDAPAQPQPRRERVVESFSLLGTLEYEKGRVAFFEGSSSNLRKSAKVDDTIAGCKITAIEPSVITLEADGKPVQLKVGYMLRREDQGQWQAREAERPYEAAISSGFSSGFSSGSSFGSPFGGSSFNSRDSRSSSFSSRDSRTSSSSRSSSPFGGGNPAEMAQSRIREQDRNGDGRISREEADSRLRDRFQEIDRNRDGSVDSEEYTAYYTARFGGSSSTPSTTGNSFNSGSSFNQGQPTFNSGSFNNSASPGSFSSGSSGNTSSSGGSTSGSTSSGGGESDLLRRLMEQRARENR